MKKLFILTFLLPLIFLACKKEPNPEPELIRAYCYLYHFIPGLESVVWEVAGFEVPNAQLYSNAFPGAVILQEDTEEITFTVKRAVTKEVLISQIHQLDKDIYYNVVVGGTAEDPELLFLEIDTKNHPQSGSVKFQVLHALTGQDSVDVYMGGITADKKRVSGLDFLNLSDPFELSDNDARSAIIVTKHTEEYQQDSVLLSSVYNENIVSGASHLGVVAPSTFEEESDPTIWIYTLPLEY
ncbi:MAG: hypothetical protein ACFFDS_08435 [Candidatus Thorarchaeota archaeon]